MSAQPWPPRFAALALALLLASCSAIAPPPPAPVAPAATTSAPSPTRPPAETAFLRLLAERDRAHAAGDVARTLALVAADAPEPFRVRERALAESAPKRNGLPPVRTPVSFTPALDGGATLVAAELDDQGRERRVRYFATGPADAPLLTEHAAAFGEERTLEFPGGSVQYRAIDEQQAQALARVAARARELLVARLGDGYRSGVPLSLALRPDVVARLPVYASAYVDEGSVTFLTSASMLVEEPPGAEWTRTVVAHEVAHVLLFQRGSGTFLWSEGLPLWLTDDRRQPELDRLVAADALWTLDRLLDGPREPAEFFAGYAQASSFVRFVAARHGERAVLAVWEAGPRLPFLEAFRANVGVDLGSVYREWRASLGR